MRTRISKTVREKDSQGLLIASALEEYDVHYHSSSAA